MRKVLFALGATLVAAGSTLPAQAATKAAGTADAKPKYVSKCKAPEKWNAVEGKCEKVAAKSKKAVKKVAVKAAPKTEAKTPAPEPKKAVEPKKS